MSINPVTAECLSCRYM